MSRIHRRWLLLPALLIAVAIFASACEPAPYWPSDGTADTGTANTTPEELTDVSVTIPKDQVTDTDFGDAVAQGTAPDCKPEEHTGCENDPVPYFTVWTSWFVYNCPFFSVTCTFYFTIKATRYISRNGALAFIGLGVLPRYVAIALGAVLTLANYQADKAIAAVPDRCLIIKHLKSSYAAIVSVGTVYHENHYCRSGY